ncbi:TraR/DksA C4-type zinc finger protein [Thioalkalivibrio thiocyanodenitrificans]|uniref:TraR/DksA C4-type zinc finger protein n=1 Tax=Thioalkalivibrio thiocyanodenitrificans TaxID=243063 RepID=UPI000381D258|nr:TraR/DksA C4-type zinc finger protein [Thioalkalivibrio thiocyanodenitrificans]
MADDADWAGEITDQEVASILKARAQDQQQQTRALPPSRELCLDCDDPIEDYRKRTIPGVQRCAECEDWHQREKTIRAHQGR